jgi:hypothetical protein
MRVALAPHKMGSEPDQVLLRREHHQERLTTLDPSISSLDTSLKLACQKSSQLTLKMAVEEVCRGLEARGPKAFFETGLTAYMKMVAVEEGSQRARGQRAKSIT